ncbi:MAG TPA: folylpolyglutamate synthase/dihydrofolate synthase family protein [Candidatus Hydrogenedentes bacterium]|nr:folylpolyglutamate synthase/dihydrofolate synthase family protein [Candidatus Hydrogenedentota bacterium]HQH52452.1 folylpolyglutamate synthase/dihydrofolate synthase family protein [Candidatus Hydrogenedentota bacterium]
MNAREYLASLEFHGVKLGLDNIRRLLAGAGNPHASYPSVHVGGTNGKGSVVAMLDAICRAAGLRTGRYTSPHIIDVNERFLINGHPVSDAELDETLAYFRRIAETMAPPPTYFEVVTAVAFRIFQQEKVDIALVEVGLGGRFDATNVITPVAAAITNVDLEHTQYLGDTLEKIAFEKAGILKDGVPVVTSETRSEPMTVILERARALNCPVHLMHRDFDFEIQGAPWNQVFAYRSDALRLGPLTLGLAADYQGPNAAVAAALAECLMQTFPRLGEEAIIRGLETAKWPCRLERVLEDPPVIIDVAHNPAGIRQLVRQVSRCAAVMAVSSDKNAAEMVRHLATVADPLILTQFTGHRALPVGRLCAAAGQIAHQRVERLEDAIMAGMRAADATKPLLITGSVYTAGQARAMLMAKYNARPLQF